MPKNRNLTYSDRQADASRLKKQGQTTPPPATAPATTPAPSKNKKKS